tara:strand:- start:609 stop:1760 length:1152 start_codon:yes stop_codon:yes gene_type:complete
MTLQVANNAFGELNADINDSVTTIVLKSGNGARFPSLAGSQYFYATLIDTSNNLEIVKCTARSSDTLTVVRAQDGTSARSFVANDRIELRPVAAFFDTYQQKEASVDMNGTELILDADGDTSITADTDDQIDIKIGGSDKISLTSSGSTINNKVSIIADDGVVDNDWILELHNNEATDDRSYGLKVSAGSTTVDRALDVRDHTSASNFLQVNGTGFVSRPQTPCVSATKNVTSQLQTISGTNMYVVTGLDSSYGNSHSVNNKSYFDSSTSRFTIPTGQPTGFYFCSFQTVMGIAIPSSGTNWGYMAIRKNDSTSLSNNHICEAYREIVNATAVSSWSWETLQCHCVVSLSAGQWVEPIFSGSAGIQIYIHSGNYTNFSVAQIG